MSTSTPGKSLFNELEANPRLRWGIWAIVAIVWLYGVLLLRDEVPRQADAYRTVARKLVRTQAVASQTEWAARRAEALTAQVEYENRLWRATSTGLAQASFNDWLSQLAEQTRLARTNITVATQEESAVPGTWKVSARMSLDFAPQTFYPMLARVSANDKRVVIESLTIRSAPVPRAEMLLVALFRNPANAPVQTSATEHGRS